MKLKQEVEREGGKSAIIKKFDYRYIWLKKGEDVKEVKLKITDKKELIGRKHKKGVYEVVNYREFIYNKEFLEILKEWIES